MRINIKLVGKILLVIVIVVALIVLYLACLIQLPRYFRLKKLENYDSLERKYLSKPKAGNERYVISLSTIPDRIHLIGPTLASLLDQSVRVDEIAINVPYISRKGLTYHIPRWLKDMKTVTIHRVDKDEGPATKLLPTLRRESPHTRIIVVDDDNIYNSGMLKHLITQFEKKQCQRERIALTNYGFHLAPDGKLPPMKERVRAVFASAEDVDLLQGFSGFLVIPEFFPREAYTIENCPKEAISVDDIWFTGWLHKNGVRIRTPGNIYKQIPIINFGKMRQTTCLAHGENKDFITDQIVINWFMEEHHFEPVLSRASSKRQ